MDGDIDMRQCRLTDHAGRSRIGIVRRMPVVVSNSAHRTGTSTGTVQANVLMNGIVIIWHAKLIFGLGG